MTYNYELETAEVFQLRRALERANTELDMYKCYKSNYETRIARLKDAQCKAHLPFMGVIG